MSRSVLPPDRAGKLIIAAIIAPIFAKKLKPVVKMAGKGLVKAGEFVQRMADEANGKNDASAPGTPEAQPASNSDMSDEAKVTTSSPIGHEEVEAHDAAEAAGDGATPNPAPTPSKKKARKLEPDQKLNPKRTKNSRER